MKEVNPALDALMEEGSRHMSTKQEEAVVASRKSKAQRPSKYERTVGIKKIKKL